MSVFDDVEDLLSVFKCRIISRVSHYSTHSWESDGKDRNSTMTHIWTHDSLQSGSCVTDLTWAKSNKISGSRTKQRLTKKKKTVYIT